MKGIVIDINNKNAIILSDNGLFKKIKNRNYEIGQTLQIRQGGIAGLKQMALKPVVSSKLVTGAARIAAVLAIGTAGAFAWYTPTDYISLDVNPSVEYSINMFDRILDVHAVNEDGEEILAGLHLKNKKIEDGLRATLDELIAEGYLINDPDSGVVIATSNDRQTEAEKMAKELRRQVQAYLDSRKDVTAKVDAGAASPAKVQEAKDMGVTPGKLHLVEKLQASTTSAIDMEQWLAKPVKDINKQIKKNWETTGWKPNDQAQQTNDPYWNWNNNGDRDWNEDDYQVWSQNRSWSQYWAQPERTGSAKAGSSKDNSSSNGNKDNNSNGDSGSPDKSTYQRKPYWPQTEAPGQTKTTAPAVSEYQNWNWNQNWAQPATAGPVNGSGNKDNNNKNDENNTTVKSSSKNNDKKENNGGGSNSDSDRNNNNKDNNNKNQSQKWNQNWSQSWSENWNQTSNKNWNQTSGQNRNQSEEQSKTTSGAAENGGYGGYGSWGKSGSQDDDDDDDGNRSGSKYEKSKDRD